MSAADRPTAGRPADAAEVRPGEQLAWDRLEAYLVEGLGGVGVSVEAPMEVLQFPNGSANLTYWVRFGEQAFVVRRPPFGQIAPGAHDMKREFRVLSRLWEVYDRAPRAYLLCEDHDVVGSDFVVMEYRSGQVIWDHLPPEMAAAGPDAGRRIGFAVVDALADLHLVEPASCGLERLGRPDGFVERQVSGWWGRWELVATPDHDAAMRRGHALLLAGLPDPSRVSILHNDVKPDNCQFRVGEPDRVASVFDWDMATLGDPLIDLGTLLNYWPDPGDTPDDHSHHVEGLETVGLPGRAEVVEHYAARTGVGIDGVAWYEAFACWKTAVVLQQLWQRWVRGESTDERMAERGRHVGDLAHRALRLLGSA